MNYLLLKPTIPPVMNEVVGRFKDMESLHEFVEWVALENGADFIETLEEFKIQVEGAQ